MPPMARPSGRFGRHRRSSARREFVRRHRERRGLATPDAKWSATSRFALLGPRLSDSELASARADALLRRHGVVTRHALRSDGLDWDWRPIYDALNLMELRGTVRRGYFVRGLGGVQFAANDFVECMRASKGVDASDAAGFAVFASSDPSWVLRREMIEDDAGSAGVDLLLSNKLGGATVVFGEGPVLVSYGGGSRIFAADEVGDETLLRAVEALIEHLFRVGGVSRVRVSEWDGEPVLRSIGAEVLASAGLRRDYPYMIADALTRRARESVYH